MCGETPNDKHRAYLHEIVCLELLGLLERNKLDLLRREGFVSEGSLPAES